MRYPDMVKRAAPIAGTAKNTDHDFLYTTTLNEAIMTDPAWAGGHYTDPHAVDKGLRRQADLWTVMGYSTDAFKREMYRDLGFASFEEFRVGFTQGYFAPMDPNDLLTLAWKWQCGDVSRLASGNLGEALGRIKAKVFVMPIDKDMFFPPADCEFEQKMTPNSEFRVVHTDWGHLGLFGLEPDYVVQIDKHLGELLAIPV